MPTVKQINDFINSIAPYNTQCDFDNSGFLVGNSDKEVKTVAVALDLTSQVLEESVKAGAELLVTHHPVIFYPKKNLIEDDLVLRAIQSGISVISAHTCFDCADGGVNDVLADILELKDIEKVESDECVVPMARAGRLSKAMNPREFAKFVADKLGTTVQLVSCNKDISKVAVCGGAGMSFAGDVIGIGADVLVTGEAKHNHLIEAKDSGLSLVIAGHFETEYPAMKVIADKISEAFPEVKTILVKQNNPVEYIANGT